MPASCLHYCKVDKKTYCLFLISVCARSGLLERIAGSRRVDLPGVSCADLCRQASWCRSWRRSYRARIYLLFLGFESVGGKRMFYKNGSIIRQIIIYRLLQSKRPPQVLLDDERKTISSDASERLENCKIPSPGLSDTKVNTPREP